MSPIETLNCNECGALIQVPASARYVTCNRCGTHLTVQRTGIATYTEATRKPPAGAADPAVQEMAGRLERLERESELARIDREWEMERERYKVTSRYGRRYVPSAAAAVVMGVIAVGFGLFWTVMAFGMTAGVAGAPGFGSIFPLFGLVFIVGGAGVSIYQYNKAEQYQAALAEYQRRRAEAAERLRD